jgi:hypothetical protein
VSGGRVYHATFSLEGYCSQTREVVVGDGPALLDVALEPSGVGVPSSPQPPDGARNAELAPTLHWSDTGAPSYDVFLGAASDPPKVGTAQANTFPVPQPLESGKSYFWKVAATSPCGSAPGPTWSFSTRPYTVAGVVKRGNPFRLVVSGTGFTGSCSVLINGAPAPVTISKGPSGLVAKGGAALKAMAPRGTPLNVTVEDPQGGSSNTFTFQW